MGSKFPASRQPPSRRAYAPTSSGPGSRRTRAAFHYKRWRLATIGKRRGDRLRLDQTEALAWWLWGFRAYLLSDPGSQSL
jgi:hypothetical protein